MAASDGQDTSRNNGRTPLVFDEVRWVVQIRRSLEEGAPGSDDDDTGIPVSVFNVPKPLQAYKPEAYTPQFIALGPYHHWRPELYEMDRYKLAAARRAQKRLRRAGAEGLKLEALVQQFARQDRRVRAYYHRYLDFGGETLAWMMVVDGAFLLEFLQIYDVADGEGGGDRALRRVSSRMAHLVDFAGRKSAHNLILRDMLMLENQVPLFLLRKILEPQCASADEAAATLQRMVTGLMKELCPFKMMESFPAAIDVAKHAHLLEVLYCLLVPKPAADDHDAEANGGHDDCYDIEEQQPADGSGAAEDEKPVAGGCENVTMLISVVWGVVSGLKSKRLRYVTRPIAFAVKAPWKMLTVLPGFSAMKNPVESFFMSSGDGNGSTNNNPSAAGYLTRPPLIEEITVPSVSELASVGVKFSPAAGGLSSIAFDAKTATFHLPAVTLDSNTETVLRNLVAYEASAALSGPLALARYTELMNGIVDADEDVALLRRSGVVLNRMKSDGEAAKMWNGMTRSVRLTKVSFVDKAVEEANRYYEGRWRVKTKRFMRSYIFNSWQLLTFLAAVAMLLLTTLQAFCSVYTCSRWFGAVTVATAE